VTQFLDLIKNVRVSAVGLFLLTILWFAPVAQFGFLTYDDPPYVTNNAHVRQGLSKESIRWAFVGPHHSMWHPVTSLSHLVDVQLFGMKPGFHHIVNVVIHAANAVLLYLWLLVLFNAPARALLVAMLFAWHPLRVESVAWVAERKDVLCTLFWLLTLHAYTRYVRSPSGKNYAWVVVAFLLGVMSKPIIVMLPVVLLLLDFWPFNRLGITEKAEGNGWQVDRPVLLQRLWEKAPLFVLSLLLAFITYKAQHEGNVLNLMSQTTILQRCGNALVSYVRYLGLIVWPVDLSVLYPHPGQWPLGKVIAAALVLIGGSILCWRCRREQPWWLLGWGWFLVTLLPVSGLIQAGGAALANRYTYISTIGLLFAAVWSAAEFAQRSPLIRRYTMIAAGVVVVVLITLTAFELPYWKNTETLFSKAIRVTKNNPIAHLVLGNVYLDSNRLDEALDVFARGLEINPNESKIYLSAGQALLEAGRLDEAMQALRSALKLDPQLDEAAFQMARVLRRAGKANEARAVLQKYLELHPENASAWNNLGAVQATQGDLTGAERSFQNAVKLKPEALDAWRNLIRLMVVTNRPQEALGLLEQALQIKSDDAELWYQAGLLHEQVGQPAFARKNYEAALMYRMHWELPSESLAWLLIQQPTIPERDAKNALTLVNVMLAKHKGEPVPPRWLELRGCVLAANGDFVAASKEIEQAKALYAELKDQKAIARNNDQLAAFKQRRVWTAKPGQR
jgi:tetratricopeptide (TPR) repeat protein